jgi:hypothetical protein
MGREQDSAGHRLLSGDWRMYTISGNRTVQGTGCCMETGESTQLAARMWCHFVKGLILSDHYRLLLGAATPRANERSGE